MEFMDQLQHLIFNLREHPCLFRILCMSLGGGQAEAPGVAGTSYKVPKGAR